MTNSVSDSASNKKTIAAFFAGVGGIELGFEQTGEFRVVYANEFDKNAQITYELNHDVVLDKRDIKEVKENEVPVTNVVMGGFPCQAFSIAGYRKGFEDDRGDLFFDLLRIINANSPEVIFLENVKNMVGHDHGNTFKVIREALVMNGYFIKWKVLNGKDYGNVPQNRERIYIVGFRNKKAFEEFEFPGKIDLEQTIHDIIDFELQVDERYYYTEEKQTFYPILEKEINSHDTVYQWRRQYVRENMSGVVPTLTANMGTGGHNVPLIYTNDKRIRKLTPRETFNAQGYPKDFKLPDISNGQLYKQAGNSVVVPVIRRIAENIHKAIENNPVEEQNSLELIGAYSLIFVDIQKKFEGSSYVEGYFDSYEELKSYIDQYDIELLSDEEYINFIKKDRSGKFHMIEHTF